MLLMDAPKRSRGRPKDPNSKRSLGVPRTIKPKEVFHLSQGMHDALTKYVASLEIPPHRSSVIRAALAEFLHTRGFWPSKRSD